MLIELPNIWKFSDSIIHVVIKAQVFFSDPEKCSCSRVNPHITFNRVKISEGSGSEKIYRQTLINHLLTFSIGITVLENRNEMVLAPGNINSASGLTYIVYTSFSTSLPSSYSCDMQQTPCR
jgi:hypothetical protein